MAHPGRNATCFPRDLSATQQQPAGWRAIPHCLAVLLLDDLLSD